MTVKDLVQEMIISCEENLLATWSLLLSERQEFLINHLERVPGNPIQQGTLEMRDEVFSNLAAENVDTSGYRGSDQDDVEFDWEKDQLVSVFGPVIATPFSPTAFDDSEMGGSAENPILLDKS